MRAVLLVALALPAAACTDAAAGPVPPPTPARLSGDQIFDSICARCHGPEGRGGPPDSTGVGPRNFHDHDFQRARSDADLARVIRTGKNGHMPAFGAAFDDAQLAALVARIRSYDPQEVQK